MRAHDQSSNLSGRVNNFPTPSYDAIMIPQAGVILAIRGVNPANNVAPPSVRRIFNIKGIEPKDSVVVLDASKSA
jgi:hypothetical protein